MVTPAARWTRAPIWAHDPTRTCESTIVPAPTQAPTLTYEGGITTTPSPRCAPRRTAVPPGTIRHGPPARSARGGIAARSRKVSGPAVQSTRGPVREAGEDRGLDLGPDRQPSGAVGSGSAARTRPASRSARIGRRIERRREARRCLGGHATASRRVSRLIGRDPAAGRLDEAEVAKDASPSPPRRPRRSAGAALGPSRVSSRPISRRAAFTGTGFGPPRKLPRKSGSQRSWIRRAASQSPASAAAHRRDELARDLVRCDRDDAVATQREDRQRPGVVAGEDRDVARPVAADPGDLLEVAARLLDRHDPRVLGQPQERVGVDVGAGPRRDVVDDDRQVALVGDRPEMGLEHPAVGPVVVRRDDERGVRTELGGATGRPDRGCGVVRAGPGDHPDPVARRSLRGDLDGRGDQPLALVGRQGRGLAGRPARDEAVDAGQDLPADEAPECGLVELAVGA